MRALPGVGAYTAAARLVVDGEETPAFTLRTRPAPPAIPATPPAPPRMSGPGAVAIATNTPPAPLAAAPQAAKPEKAPAREGERRPAKLNLTAYPYLPATDVRTTRAADYAMLAQERAA